MKRNHIAAALLIASCLVLGSLVLNSFVSYAPSVTKTQIQNFYIESILWHCAVSAALQVVGILLLLACRNPPNPDPLP
jgi:hypothetical protein